MMKYIVSANTADHPLTEVRIMKQKNKGSNKNKKSKRQKLKKYIHMCIHLYTHKDKHLYIACYIIVILLYISVMREKFICVLSH